MLIIAVIVFALDVVFESMNTYGIDKIKSLVTSSQTNNEVNENVEESNTVTDNSEVETTPTPEETNGENTSISTEETTEPAVTEE